ncbi:MAG TPA: sulfotransferase [Paracoccus sp. (in: a-proteobacteria)]|nr:sulfotransferase [Paracoccus sp. (in: a-proteobacteria)]
MLGLGGRRAPDLPKWDADGRSKKPAIVGIGAQKAGTTWLSQMLSQHPQVWTPPFKEAQYFNYLYCPEHRDWLPWHFRRARQNQQKRHDARGETMPAPLSAYLDRITRGEMFTNHWYKQIFAPAPEGVQPCDITPEYSTLPDEGVEFVAKFLPKARFIYIIRHPVDRAVSQLKMNLTRKGRKPATLDAWMQEIEDPVLLDRGDYAAYVPRWRAHFGEDRLLIVPFGQIARDPVGLLRRIEAFTGLPAHDYRNADAKVFAAPSGLSVPPEARAALRAKLAGQFDFLEAQFGCEFTDQIR